MIREPDGRPARVFIQIIGVLLLLNGLLLFSTGQILHSVGSQAKERYRSSAGGFLRMFSQKDQNYYNYARAAVFAGPCFKVLSMFVCLVGGLVLWAPNVFYLVVVRLLREGSCAQQDSNLQPTD